MFKKYSSFLIIGAISAIIGFNLISSQQISPLYVGLVNGDKDDLVTFLKKTTSLPQSKKWIKSAMEKYGQQEIKRAVFSSREQQLARIKKLEQILKKNPNARDILYGLSVTYKQLNNDKLSKIYLHRAKKIDPEVEKQSLVRFIN